MKFFKVALILLAVLFIGAQFFRPPKNDGGDSHSGFLARYSVPSDVEEILRNSCFDCHSNTTRYPWYAEIQPAGWFLNQHIMEGKKRLNFSHFDKYRVRLQHHKLEEILDQVEEGEMPLPSYTLIHWSAKLSPRQKERLNAWVSDQQKKLEELYPDSLGL